MRIKSKFFYLSNKKTSISVIHSFFPARDLFLLMSVCQKNYLTFYTSVKRKVACYLTTNSKQFLSLFTSLSFTYSFPSSQNWEYIPPPFHESKISSSKFWDYASQFNIMMSRHIPFLWDDSKMRERKGRRESIERGR